MPLIYKPKYITTSVGDKKITFRPWTTKEEKAYLKAIENEKTKITDKLLFDILIRPCLEEKDKDIVLSVSEQKLLLIEIRKVSISETFNDTIICEECKEKSEEVININDIHSYKKANYSTVELKHQEDVFIFEFGEIKSNKDKERLVLDDGLISYIFTDFLLHIKSIQVNGELSDKFSFKELEKFMDSLPTKIFDALFEKYQEMVDSLDLCYKFTCPSCNNSQKIEYNGRNIPNFLWL